MSYFQNITLEVKKVKRSWCVMAGTAKLAKFRTEELAKKSLQEKPEYYEYWANSSSVQQQFYGSQ